MNRYLLLIVYALVGIFVSSCAPIPHYVVPKPAYGSHSGAPHHLPVHHSPRRAAVWCIIECSTPRITTATRNGGHRLQRIMGF